MFFSEAYDKFRTNNLNWLVSKHQQILISNREADCFFLFQGESTQYFVQFNRIRRVISKSVRYSFLFWARHKFFQ